MTSAKTKRLLSTLTQYADVNEAEIKVLLISHVKAKERAEGKDISKEVSRKGVSCHASDFYKPSEKITLVETEKLKDVDVTEFSVIGIDEGHFFSDLFETVKLWKCEKKKTIYVAGLDGSATRQAIGQMLDLIPLADDYQKCKAVCKQCVAENKGIVLNNKFPASFTKCKIAMSGTVMVGGGAEYVATCEKHWEMPPGS